MPSAASMSVIDLLATWGPGCDPSVSSSESRRYCHDLAIEHGENFSVLSRFVPERMHDGMCAVYAFCRWSDDLGDEIGDRDRSTELLSWWRSELDACFDGRASHPVFVALAPVIE
ncbi:MAG: squalene/phytoene synthase family protein, partial [Planctomycetota bacterium]|nr:squalene/phytoene synthase family protein [Planctomycetota bacterium]